MLPVDDLFHSSFISGNKFVFFNKQLQHKTEDALAEEKKNTKNASFAGSPVTMLCTQSRCVTLTAQFLVSF